ARELLLLHRLRHAGNGDGAEGVDEADDGSEETDEGRDVRERPQRTDALLDGRFELTDLLAHRSVALFRTSVRVRWAGFDELQNRIVAGVAQLDRAIDVSGDHELLHLREELLRVHAVPRELKHR